MHLTTEELRRWRQTGAAADRDRVVGHLADCDACGARYAELIRTRPVEAAGPGRFRAADFTVRGLEAFRAPSRRGSWVPAWAPAAAAVMVVVALAVGYLVGPARDGQPTYRGEASGVELVRPIDDRVPVADLVFEWHADADLGPFRLRVIDLAAPDAPVIDREDAHSGYKPTPEERQRLKPGITYRWFVEFRSPGGGVDTSPAGRFEIE